MIRVRGAREHNLQGVDLDLPVGRLTALVGPSGSGKSSFAFDTVHAEGQRRYLEALVGRERGAPLPRPDVDLVDGLPPTLGLDQRGAGPSPRRTVAVVTDIASVLRVLVARAGTAHCGSCGSAIRPVSHDEIVSRLLAIGGRAEVEAPVRRQGRVDARAFLEEVGRLGFSRVRVDGEVLRLDDVAPARLPETLHVVVDRLRLTPDRRSRLQDAVRTAASVGRGVVVATVDGGAHAFVDRPYCATCDRQLPPLEPSALSWFGVGACAECAGKGVDDGGATCAGCEGQRLGPEARAARFEGEGIVHWSTASVDALAKASAEWARNEVTAPLIDELGQRLAVLQEVGLGACSLGERLERLSRGERQRLRIARHVAGALSGVVYVIDEPTTALDEASIRRVLTLLRRLVDAGNTVLVVDHHPAVLAIADRIVEFGPGPGRLGGKVVFDGTLDELRLASTVTARWLTSSTALPPSSGRSPTGLVRAGELALPLGVVLALEGPNGSGKTRLLERALEVAAATPEVSRVVVADQRSVPRSARSNAATYTGLWDVLRPLLAATREARVRGFTASHFSLNTKGGRCESCKGTGLRRVVLDVLPDVYSRCPVCNGRRFAADVLEVRWRGFDPSELLEGTASDVHPLLAGHPELERILRALVDVGLGYLPLGQPGHTLSGGEAQRLKLAKEIARATKRGADGTVIVLDDPTSGLHPADVAVLVALLERLVDAGATVWMATHDAALRAWADERLTLG